MKWKDSGEVNEPQEEKPKEEFFDEEHYSPWATRKDSVKGGRSSKFPLIFILLGLAIVTSLAALLTLLMSSKGGAPGNKEYAQIEERMRQVEERLNNYEAIDEKVTRIWEQAKAFEKSASLRMDHITTSLEALQKQIGEARKAEPPAAAKKTSDKATSSPTQKKSSDPAPEAAKPQYHTVAAGDTFYSISKRYNISLEDLFEMNRLDKTSTLQLGQKLVVGKE
ncbi:MAG: LysM peptidoglycan-binding domain-containing protein [Desulfobacterales bacterium]|nr:LysM peptidoglycan-binding domain-containing protein [Desulfobacterales bacterium]